MHHLNFSLVSWASGNRPCSPIDIFMGIRGAGKCKIGDYEVASWIIDFSKLAIEPNSKDHLSAILTPIAIWWGTSAWRIGARRLGLGNMDADHTITLKP